MPISRNGYAAAVDACCAMGVPEVALGVLDAVVDSGFVPNGLMYSAIFKAIFAGRPEFSSGWRSVSRDDGDDNDNNDDDDQVPREFVFDFEAEEDRQEERGQGDTRRPEDNDRVRNSVDDAGRDGVGVGVVNGHVSRRGPDEEWRDQEGKKQDPNVGEKADMAVSLLSHMRGQDVLVKGSTYALVASALMDAGRPEDVLALWQEVRCDRRR